MQSRLFECAGYHQRKHRDQIQMLWFQWLSRFNAVNVEYPDDFTLYHEWRTHC